jgi:hypothetical protein
MAGSALKPIQPTEPMERCLAGHAGVMIVRRRRAMTRLVQLTGGVSCDKFLSPTTGALHGDGRARWCSGVLTVEDRRWCGVRVRSVWWRSSLTVALGGR